MPLIKLCDDFINGLKHWVTLDRRTCVRICPFNNAIVYNSSAILEEICKDTCHRIFNDITLITELKNCPCAIIKYSECLRIAEDLIEFNRNGE